MKSLQKSIGILVSLLLFYGIFNPAMAQYKKDLQYYRPTDQSGIYMFTPTKADKGYTYEGFKMYVGAALTQQWQDLTEKTASNINLTPIGPGFNLPTANLYLDAQLTKGMRLHLTTYLSSRHHTEAYVKGGYLRIDAFPMLHSQTIDNIMQYLTIKIGDMETNYGDAHLLRSDNANTIYNPLVGNYLMDSFTTMDGAEFYLFDKGFIGMIGLAGGQFGEKPSVQNPKKRKPSIYGKIGYDTKINDNTRFRLTGSIYHSGVFTDLYHGDRAGSRYYNIMLDATSAGDAWSGRVSPGFSNGFTSIMINPYLQTGNLNLFGILESTTEMGTGHNVQQFEVNARYYLSKTVYVAGRYNIVQGYLSGATSSNASVNRVQIGGGWFLTPNILAKVEYVSQKYQKFSAGSVYNGGKFNGLMVEAAIGF